MILRDWSIQSSLYQAPHWSKRKRVLNYSGFDQARKVVARGIFPLPGEEKKTEKFGDLAKVTPVFSPFCLAHTYLSILAESLGL